MLSRTARGSTNVINSCHGIRWFAASASGQPSAFTDWSTRYDNLAKQYPQLFSDNFLKDQQTFLSKNYTKANLEKILTEYDKGRKAIDQATGEPVFLSRDLNTLVSNVPKPVHTYVQSKEEAKLKLNTGTKYVTELLKTQDAKVSNVQETNLRMIKVAEYADAIDHWRARLPDDQSDSSDLGFPISDAELDHWVERQYFHAPDNVRVQTGTHQEHRKVEEEWMKLLDQKLVKMLKERDANFDDKKFNELLNTTNEMFHPFKIDHYNLSNYAKALFRATLWKGKDRLSSVEESINKIFDLLQNRNDNDSKILRTMYEKYPDTPMSKLSALQLSATDPLFAASLCDEARAKLEQISWERAVKDVLRDLELPYINFEKSALESELSSSMSRNPSSMQREIAKFTAEAKSFEIEVPTLEQVLDDLLPIKLWGNDHTKVKESILNYSNGKGSLEDVHKSIELTLTPKSESGKLEETDLLHMSVRYHNSRFSDIEYWNFHDFLLEANRVKTEDTILHNRRIVKRKLESLGCDELVVNMVRTLVEDGQTPRLPHIVEDYQDIMKRYRGEIDGIITSAEPLDDKVFEQLRQALETANPGKKITLDRVIDAGLGAGFIVKAGVQRFDFSLATVIHEGRKSISSQ